MHIKVTHLYMHTHPSFGISHAQAVTSINACKPPPSQ